MILKRSIQNILLGFILWFCLFVGVGQNPIIAVTLRETGAATQDRIEPLDRSSGVDRFLTSIPPDYYTITNVVGLKKSLLENPSILLVDVREPSEYQSGHIPNAVNIPLRTLTDNLDKIPRDRPVVLYCSSGYRSAMGVMALHLLDYENVQGFPPSFAGWKTAGEAISKKSTSKPVNLTEVNLSVPSS